MSLKKICLCVVTVLLIMIVAGCEQSTSADETLTVYLDAYTKEYMNGLIDQFLLEHPNVNVVIEDYSSLTIPDYRTKLAGDLMAGEGPDVILAANTTNNTVQNLTKLLQNGAFLDLNELELDLSSCDSRVLKTGIYNEKQYLIPLNYSLGFLLTTEERLDNYDIVLTDDLPTFAASLDAVYEAEKNAFLDIFTIEFLYRQNGLDLIDYQNNSLSASQKDIDMFRTLSVAYTNLFPNVFDGNNIKKYQFINCLKEYNYSVEEAFLTGDLVFFSAPAFMGAYENISHMNAICKKLVEMGETPVLYKMPACNGEGTAPCPNYFLLANGSTKNKELVKQFIESSIGEASQYAVSSQLGIPINNQMVEHMHDFYVEGLEHPVYTFTSKCKFPHQFTDSYFAAIEDMVDGTYIDVMSCGRLFSILREYATNGGNIDAAFFVGKQQLEMYLTE